jgi:hypothetical protein
MMPSSSKKQHNFMEAIAHSPSFAKKVGVPQKVGQDFVSADKGRKFSKGGDMATMDPRVAAMMAAKMRGARPMPAAMPTGMKKGGMAAFEKSGKDVEKRGMKEGSKADMAMDKKQMMGMKKGGMATKKMAAGGFTKEANGIARKGLTKATQIKMAKGGKAC